MGLSKQQYVLNELCTFCETASRPQFQVHALNHPPTHLNDKIIQTSDRNEIEVSRAHRRGTYAGSPISTVASAALAVKVASTDKSAFDPAHKRKPSLPSSPASKLWQRATEVGDGAESGANGTVRYLGFNVVAAIRALHGVSVQQLKQRLDERTARMEEVRWDVSCVSC